VGSGFVEGVGQVASQLRSVDGFGGIGRDEAVRGEVAEENLQGDEVDAGAGRGEAIREPPMGEVVGEVAQLHRRGIVEATLLPQPGGEGFERAPHRELVVVGESPLHGEVADEWRMKRSIAVSIAAPSLGPSGTTLR